MKYKLKDIAVYSNKKIKVNKINKDTYISTENMLPNKSGVVKATKLPNQSKTNFFENKNILISNIRPYFKKIWFANFNGGCSNDVLNIKIKDETKVLPKYLYYNLLQDSFFEYIMSGSKGTKMPRGDKEHIMEYIINIPDIDKQIKIVNILDKLNLKIELNNQINNNLYEYAISYLKSVVSDVEVAISSLGKVQGGYAFKSKDLKDNKTRNRIIKIKNLRSEINADINNSQFVDDDVILNIDKKFELHKGDVAIAMTGAELGKTGFIYGKDKYYLNQRVGVIKGSNKETELYLRILMLSKDFQTLLNSKGYGSAQPNISTTDIENIMINNITEENLAVLYKTINPIYQKIINNCEENINLEQLRETLLPKLMNGEIDLDKIKI